MKDASNHMSGNDAAGRVAGVHGVARSENGRVQQKARTRAELIRAARALMDGGIAPTVEEAATSASVSRATAYRYFPSRHALLVAAYPELTAESLLGEHAPRDTAARLDLVLEGIARQMLEHEPVLRTMLRLSLEARTATPDDLPFRVGRRIVWVRDALEPLRGELSEPDRERLVLAIASAVGIDALVWLTDVAGLTRPEAVDLMCWSARTLLQAARTYPS
jgi:AcrR family transcriptional regulator